MKTDKQERTKRKMIEVADRNRQISIINILHGFKNVKENMTMMTRYIGV